MKESKFVRVGPGHQFERPTPGTVGLRQAEKMFFTSGHLTSTDIKTMAQLIAKDVRAALVRESQPANVKATELFGNFVSDIMVRLKMKAKPQLPTPATRDQPTVLLRAFEPTAMNLGQHLEKFGFTVDPDNSQKFIGPDGTPITPQDLYGSLDRIRQAVAEELHQELPDVNFYMRTGSMNMSVETLHNDHVLKGAGEASETFAGANARALEALYALPERSPHLVYPVVEHSKSWRTQIHNRLDFTNMREYTMQRPLPPLAKVVKYFADAYRGLEFLYTHNFELSDLAARNIGIDAVNDRGILFDYDFLYQRDGSSGFITSEQAMVAELASTLGKVLEDYRKDQPTLAQLKGMQQIVDRLKNKTEKDKPTISEAIKLLESR